VGSVSLLVVVEDGGGHVPFHAGTGLFGDEIMDLATLVYLEILTGTEEEPINFVYGEESLFLLPVYSALVGQTTAV
jgi:hypothetical protein